MSNARVKQYETRIELQQRVKHVELLPYRVKEMHQNKSKKTQSNIKAYLECVALVSENMVRKHCFNCALAQIPVAKQGEVGGCLFI